MCPILSQEYQLWNIPERRESFTSRSAEVIISSLMEALLKGTMSPEAHARADENKLHFLKFCWRFWKAVFICLNLSHRLIVRKVCIKNHYMVITEEVFCVIFEIICPWNFSTFFYIDLQCPLIIGRFTGRELTTATP